MTRERLTTVLILLVLAAIGTWIAFHTYWTQVTVSAPLQGEAATNPYYSVERLTRAVGIRAQKIGSLRPLPPGDAVLLVTDLHSDIEHVRFESLRRWVEGGGRLAVTANVVWSTPALQTWSGIAPYHQDSDSSGKEPPTAAAREDCRPMAVRIQGKATGDNLRICAPASEFGFISKRVPSWALSSDRGMQLLRVAIGRGSVTVIGPESVLEPRAFLQGDDAQALIDGTLLERGGQLLIFSPTQADPLLTLLWRLAAPAILCFGLAAALLIVRHLPRFGPKVPVPATARRSLAEQLRANARFSWRTGNLRSLRTAALRSLERDALRHIPGYGSLNMRQRAIELGKRAGIDEATLNSALTADAVGTLGVQRSAIALFEQTRRALLALPPTRGSAHDR